MTSPTRDHLDGQLKFSAFLPDFADWLSRMERDSRPVEAKLGLERRRTGPDPRQWLEIGAGHSASGVIPVFIHGGYWRALRAEDHRFVLPALSKLGPQVANVEYRLMPGARMNDLIEDVRGAFSAVLSEHPDCRLLPIGHSAGAHLALCALRDPVISERTAGAVLISGAFDLDLIARSFLQDELALSEVEIDQYTVRAAPQVPSLFVVGQRETAPFHDQARTLASGAAQGATLIVERSHHMNILHHCLFGDAPLIGCLSDWLQAKPIPEHLEVPDNAQTL